MKKEGKDMGMLRETMCLLFLAGCVTATPSNNGTNKTPDTSRPGTDTGSQDTDTSLVVSDLAWSHADVPFDGPITVTWNQTTEGQVFVEYQIDEEWHRTPDIDGLASENAATVVGIPLGSSALWRITLVEEATSVEATSPIEAPTIPSGLEAGDLQINEPSLWAESGAYVMIPIGGFLVIMDRQAQPVWVARASEILYAETSPTGEGIMWGDTKRSRSHRAYLDAEIATISTNGHYHAMYGLSDGTITWVDWGSSLYEVAPDTTEPDLVLRDHHLHYINGIAYEQEKDMYVLSSYASQAVLAVDRSSGDILWTAPQRRDSVGYEFDPPNHRLTNPHGIQILENGNLLASTEGRGGGVWIREYEIDDSAKMLRSVWNFDASHDDVSWSWVHREETGSTVHTLGPSGIVYEVTASSEVAWRVQYSDWTGRSEIIDDLYALVAPPSYSSEVY